jgi:hypothetical protein
MTRRTADVPADVHEAAEELAFMPMVGAVPRLNHLIVDGELVITTPCFLGADPATSTLLGGASNRPLARVEDLARDLVRSLPLGLAERAVLLPHAPSDIVTANRSRVSEGTG